MGPETITKINKKIKQAMLDADLTQTELAKKMNLKQSQISKWVKGYLNPKLSTIERIAAATGKPLNYFFDASQQVKGNQNILGNDNKASNSGDIDFLHKEISFLKKENELREKEMELIKKDIEILKLKLEMKKIKK